MKIAYLILAHTNPEQLKRLVRKIVTEDAYVFVHIDEKVEDVQEYLSILNELANVFFINNRVEVCWGGYSLVQAILNGLQEIINYGDDFDYICILSGSDYPLKSNKEIFEFFKNNYGREFIHYRQLPISEFYEGRMDRVWYYSDYDNINSEFGSKNSTIYETEMRRRRIKRDFIQGMVPYHGSTWWVLTEKCIKHILNTVHQNKDIVNYFRYTKNSDEQFFQTLVMNSPFAQNALNENLWYLDWSLPNAAHPKTLDNSDFEKIISSDALFARKFDTNISAQLLDMLDKIIKA